ncbi:MAG: hypothetical protein CL910_03300 [Deltaproteobacteria bacterium]|jgi:D-glycero-D-manno-heptose 1,7-bisphosphate phosphatase|nr:hypothetical protein [Deltaproteobacteria bacterium]
MTRYAFLDRDGTLVRDPGYVHRVEDYALLPGVALGLRQLQEAGFRLAIVTNQSGIGRGLFSEDDFARFQAHLVSDLAAQGVEIDATFHCPHGPDEGCPCRKPAPGLLEQAERQLGADLPSSWMIGDGERDARAALAAGLAGAVWLGGPAPAPGDSHRAAPDFAGAARLILKRPSPSRR